MARFPANDIISLVGSTPRYDLAESVGPDLRLADLVDPAELGDLPLAYGTAAGDPRLRGAVADAHGVGADDVVITVGGMHALFLLAFILCDRGDEAVTTTPLFPLAHTALEAVGAKVEVLTLSFDRGYRLDPYGDDPIAGTAVALGPRVISVASLSKCHGAPGLRLGWVITRDPELRQQLITAKVNTVVSCSAVDEALAVKVFERRASIIAERRDHLDEDRQRTAAWVRANNDFVEWVRPDAGGLCCVRLKPAVFDAAAVDRFYQALADKGTRVANGAWFGEERRVFRLGFGLLPMAELGDALAALAAALREAAQHGRSS